jgi:hypothetical protein
MQTDVDHTSSDPSRTGALWVAATGAFLLFAAAVVFVAVKWSDIPEGVKLAALATLTASLLVAGRLARAALPATATALFHLGAFLLPVNVAAALVRAPVDTGWVLVATGAVGVLGLGIGARLEQSPVLVAGAGLSTVVLAAGLGDLSTVPALATVLPAAALTAWTTAIAVRPRPGTGTGAEALTCATVAATLVIPIATAIRIAGEVPPFAVLGGLAVTAWALGVALDRTESPTFPALGALPRVASVAVLLPAMVVLEAGQVAVLAGGIALVAILEAVRLDQPRLVALTAVALPVAVVGVATETGLMIDEAGLAATVAAIVPLGLAGVVTDRWRPMSLLTAVTLGGLGLALASLVSSTGASALLVAGGALLGAGGLLGQPVFAGVGGVLASLGYWMHLDLADVQAADAYVVPVAIALLAVGLVAEHRGAASSWFTLTPPVLLLGGTALVERVGGGPGAHALVVGVVGAAAVLVGGRAQLLGPVVTGTALLVALTTYETLAITAGVPTWAWLAAGGTVLLAAGLAMDRADTGPVETGRRVVDVVGERFH